MDLQVPLKHLKFGQEDGAGINARVAGRLDGIEELAANLFARGQIENLIVKRFDDQFYSVSNGNRRLAAFRMMHGEDSDVLINCTLRDVDETAAFEDSLTTAVTAKQLHPVDQYEAFARLAERGKTNEEIARQYGMGEKEVRQALALGQLSPKIRDAWRGGEIKADVAKAFTLGTSHKAQDKVFAALAKAGHLYAHLVRKEFGASSHEVASLLGFAREPYLAAGGHVVEDLFGDEPVVSDVPLLKQVASDFLTSCCVKLVEDGWSWASVADELPRAAIAWRDSRPKQMIYEGDEEERLAKLHAAIKANEDAEQQDEDNLVDLDDQLEQLQHQVALIEQAALNRSFSAKQKAKTGCILSIEHGTLMIRFGVIKPEEVASAGKATPSSGGGDAPPVAEEPAISKALLHRLSLSLTEAAALALSQDLELALIVLLAGFASRYDSKVKVSVSGLGGGKLDLTGVSELPANIALLRKMTVQERVELLAPIAAASLDFQQVSLAEEAGDRHSSVLAVCNELKPDALNAALRGAFDARDYFEGVNKALCLQAIREAGLAHDSMGEGDNATKKALADFAIANVPPTGWLPPQLRAKGYDGPPNAKPKAAAAEGKPAKPSARKKTPRAAAAPAKPAKKAVAKKRKAG